MDDMLRTGFMKGAVVGLYYPEVEDTGRGPHDVPFAVVLEGRAERLRACVELAHKEVCAKARRELDAPLFEAMQAAAEDWCATCGEEYEGKPSMVVWYRDRMSEELGFSFLPTWEDLPPDVIDRELNTYCFNGVPICKDGNPS